ncbi:MAG: SIS domain-containing protein [Pseudomonadota bacterium]
MQNKINSIIKDSIATKQLILTDLLINQEIQRAIKKISTSLNNKGRLFLAGNGGSAADAQHISAEFVVRLIDDRKAFAAMALTTDTSILTAIGNDYGFDCLFERQLQAHAREGDVFIAISTSGNSSNIIQALEYCKQNNISSIGFSGKKDGKTGGKMEQLCDVCITVPSNQTARIQESHIMIGHIICLLVEQQLAA